MEDGSKNLCFAREHAQIYNTTFSEEKKTFKT